MAQAQLDEEVVYYYYLYYTVVLATILVVVARFLVVKLRRRNSGENPPPGPWQLPVIGSLHHLFGALPHHAMRDLARQHGPLMLLRLGELRLVVASSATAAREVMKTHDAAFAKRPRTTTNTVKRIRGGMGIAMAPHGEHWQQVRKLCVNELLSARQVRSFHATREAEAGRLVASVALASLSQSQPVNLGSHLATYLHDVVVRAIVGDRITDREAFLACLEDSMTAAAGLSLADLFPSSRLARAFCGRTRLLEAAYQPMTHVLDGVIKEHGNGDDDLLGVLLRMQTEGAPLHLGTIRALITDLFGAGIETTTTTLQWAMAELMRNPNVLRRAQAEVRAALAGQSRVWEKDLPGLRYIQLVIKETLRLHIAGPLLLPRECRESCRVLGYDVPKGAMVLVNAWAIAGHPNLGPRR
ncbi:hypothetical protein QYE76_005681 [Lolium multiflorum]|uniref:Cytochrome P450 n=1 Tax=Lolium multiflorum TaxID=4521 RepID=A0AAD8W3M9_LOLMU|nr:hypothetical protein QYE76_005681 [Lolium multiflorum]